MTFPELPGTKEVHSKVVLHCAARSFVHGTTKNERYHCWCVSIALPCDICEGRQMAMIFRTERTVRQTEGIRCSPSSIPHLLLLIFIIPCIVRPKFALQSLMSCVLFLSELLRPNLMFCVVQTHDVRCAFDCSNAGLQKRRCHCYVLRKSKPV